MDCTSVGNFIAELRKEKGLTQAELAERVGVTGGAVSKWERGFPKLKDTTLKTHAYITSKQNIFGGKPYEKADFLRI